EAEGALLEATELHPSLSIYPLYLGQVYYDLGRVEEALKTFRLASSLDPSNSLIQAYVGLAEMTLGRMDEGHGELLDWVRTANAAWQSRMLLLCETYLANHPDVCWPLEHLVSKEEKEARSWRLAGMIGDTMERGVIRVWHRAAKVLAALRYVTDPATRRARMAFLEGSLHYDLEEHDAAWVAFSRSLELEPDRALTRLRLIDLCLQREDYAGVLRWLDNGQEEEEEWPPAMLEIQGLALFHEGRYLEALGRLGDLVSSQPQEYLLAYYVGLCHLRLGDRQRARSWFEKAAGRLNPGIVRLRFEEMMRVRRLVSEG
ncbi:MAG: tetratricopeptide repeat protein, partial [Chloroflexota bacterium]